MGAAPFSIPSLSLHDRVQLGENFRVGLRQGAEAQLPRRQVAQHLEGDQVFDRSSKRAGRESQLTSQFGRRPGVRPEQTSTQFLLFFANQR